MLHVYDLAALTTINHMNCRLVVVLQDKTYIYDFNSLTIMDVIDTVPNTKGKEN